MNQRGLVFWVFGILVYGNSPPNNWFLVFWYIGILQLAVVAGLAGGLGWLGGGADWAVCAVWQVWADCLAWAGVDMSECRQKSLRCQ